MGPAENSSAATMAVLKCHKMPTHNVVKIALAIPAKRLMKPTKRLLPAYVPTALKAALMIVSRHSVVKKLTHASSKASSLVRAPVGQHSPVSSNVIHRIKTV